MKRVIYETEQLDRFYEKASKVLGRYHGALIWRNNPPDDICHNDIYLLSNAVALNIFLHEFPSGTKIQVEATGRKRRVNKMERIFNNFH